MAQERPPRSEFLGLHDPYRAPEPDPLAMPRPRAGPLVDREKAGELVRAGGTLMALFILIAVIITAFS